MSQHVLLEAYARGDLGQGEAAILQLEHGAFGDVGDLLAALRGQRRTEADLADLRHEFTEGAVAPDRQPTVLNAYVELPAGHGDAEDQPLGVLGDVDEAAGAVAAVAETGKIEIARFLHPRQREEGGRQ